jgi:hypothetical protein
MVHFLGMVASCSICGTTQEATNASATQKDTFLIMADVLLVAVLEQEPRMGSSLLVCLVQTQRGRCFPPEI